MPAPGAALPCADAGWPSRQPARYCASPSRWLCRRRAVRAALLDQCAWCPRPARRWVRPAAAPVSRKASARISAMRCRSPVESCITGPSSSAAASASRGASARAKSIAAARNGRRPLAPPTGFGGAVDHLCGAMRAPAATGVQRSSSKTSPSFGSRSAIMRRNRLLPEPDGPVIARHSPASAQGRTDPPERGCAGGASKRPPALMRDASSAVVRRELRQQPDVRADAPMEASLLELLVRAVHLVVVQAKAHQQAVDAEDRAQRCPPPGSSPRCPSAPPAGRIPP